MEQRIVHPGDNIYARRRGSDAKANTKANGLPLPRSWGQSRWSRPGYFLSTKWIKIPLDFEIPILGRCMTATGWKT